MSQLNFLGFDFGASSGRAMLGTFENGKMEIQEIHRFSNDPVMLWPAGSSGICPGWCMR